MRVIYVAICVVALAASRAAGQTTQPAVTIWASTAAQLADALTNENGGSRSIDALLADGVPIQEFASDERSSRYYLQRQMLGLTVVAVRAYPWPAETIASDLAADVSEAPDMPDPLKEQFVPRDEAAARQANLTAQNWVSTVLNPQKDDFVAVIMLWERQTIASSPLLGTIARETKQPILILVKGRHDTATGAIRITQIGFGDVRRALD